MYAACMLYVCTYSHGHKKRTVAKLHCLLKQSVGTKHSATINDTVAVLLRKLNRSLAITT